MTKELEDLNTGGATDEEVAAIKRQKHELELRLKDQVGSVGTMERLAVLAPIVVRKLQ